MQMQRHDTSACPDCGSRLWLGLKAEATGWSVYYDCNDCGFERRVGRVAMADVSSEDEAWERATAMGDRL